MTNKGWKIYKIDNICEVLSSKRIFAADYVKFGIPFYRSKEIIEKAFGENISNLLYIAEEKYNDIKSKYGVPKENDILISAVGERSGIPYLVRNEEFYFKDGNLIWIRNFDDRKIFSKYLCYWFKSKIGQFTLENLMIGSAQKALTIVGIKGIELNLPPLEVQNKIAKVLSALDNKIELNNAINNNLEQQAQAIFKSWFVDFEPFGGTMPSDWKTGNVSEIVEIYDSKRKPLSGNQRSNMKKRFPYYGAASLMDYVEDYIFDGLYLLLGEDGTVVDSNGFPILQYVWGKFWVNNHAHILAGKNGFNVDSLYLFFKQTPITSIVTGAVQAKISQTNLMSIELNIPTENILYKFNQLIAPLFEQIRYNTDENKNLTQLRDALLPKLMSGEIDVSKVDIDDILENQSADKLSFSIMIIEYFYIKIVIIIGVVNYKNNTFKWSNNPV